VPAASAQKSKRPFWMHQLVEYIFGGVLVAQGLQSPAPLLPAMAGALVMINASIVRGPFSAFRLVGRAVHRKLDLVVMGIVLAFAVQPWTPVDAAARMVMIGVTGALAFVWWQSSFVEKTKSRAAVSTDGGRGVEIGRLAGRAVGDGINAAKRLKRP
jgi:hypothetical protein